MFKQLLLKNNIRKEMYCFFLYFNLRAALFYLLPIFKLAQEPSDHARQQTPMLYDIETHTCPIRWMLITKSMTS